jgi:hypothetical protein
MTTIKSTYKGKETNIDKVGEYYRGSVYDKGCLVFTTSPSTLLNDVAAEITGYLIGKPKPNDLWAPEE